jgi:hypothetical protein
VGPLSHGMAPPQVANGGDGLQIWKTGKGKVVPLHAMEAFWLRGGIAPTVS